MEVLYLSNSIKLINFIISLFVFLIGSVVLNLAFGITPDAEITTNLMSVMASYLSIMLSTMLLLLSQCFFRLKYIQSKLKKLGHYNVIGEYHISPFRMVDRFIIYVFMTLPVILPFFQGETLNKHNIVSIILLFIFIIITEILFKFFNKTMKIVVTDKGITVTGYDLRLDLPISANYPYPSGFYPFERIEGFRCMKKQIILYQTYDLGTITIKAPEDDVKRIRGLLLQNLVPESKLGK